MAKDDSTSIQEISINEAIKQGLRHYFTGRPCVRGGIARRRVSDRKCTCKECSYIEAQKSRKTKLARRAMGLRYSYPYKYRQLSEETKEKRAAARKARYEQCKQQEIAKVRAWQALNMDRIKQRYRESAAERCAYQAQYRTDNAAKVHECRSRRRKAQALRTPIWYGEFDEFVIVEAAGLAVCRKEVTGLAWHVDHMIPLMGKFASGLHCGANIQVLPANINLAKGNSKFLIEPDEWLSML
ncbi:hypothetical protein [Pseudomonas aeruginosa]|nr:hypothetical protein [Pseudomonas aeruginosa]